LVIFTEEELLKISQTKNAWVAWRLAKHLGAARLTGSKIAAEFQPIGFVSYCVSKKRIQELTDLNEVLNVIYSHCC